MNAEGTTIQLGRTKPSVSIIPQELNTTPVVNNPLNWTLPMFVAKPLNKAEPEVVTALLNETKPQNSTNPVNATQPLNSTQLNL
jgi:hypothetical protein